MNLIASMSGKVCSHGDTYFVTNKQTGKVHTAKMCFPSYKAPTEAQKAQREKFAQRVTNTSKWFRQNGPSEENPKGTEFYILAQGAYKAQHKIGTFYGFVASKMKEDGTLTIGSMSEGGGAGNEGGGDIG